MKIKEGIVYDKNECVIIGITDLGNVNNTLQKFEETINDNYTGSDVAKQMLVLWSGECSSNFVSPMHSTQHEA